MRFKDRPTRDDLSGATIFTVPANLGPEAGTAGPPFTDTPFMNEKIENEPGRTLNGERIPPIKDDTQMVEQFGTETNKRRTREFNKTGVQNPPFDHAKADLLRDLPLGDSAKKSFGDDFDWQKNKLNGQ